MSNILQRFSILKHYICLCFRANIDLYQMRLAVFVGSSGLGPAGHQTQGSTLCKTHKNNKIREYKDLKVGRGDSRSPDTRIRHCKTYKNTEKANVEIVHKLKNLIRGGQNLAPFLRGVARIIQHNAAAVLGQSSLLV